MFAERFLVFLENIINMPVFVFLAFAGVIKHFFQGVR